MRRMVLGLVTILVLVIAAALGWVDWSYWHFSADMAGDVARLAAAARPPGATVTEQMLSPLPEPAQRYLRASRIVGKPIPTTVTLFQKGRIRNSPTADWMALDAEETYSLLPPAFVWRAWLPSRGLPMAIGRDQYAGGKGSILIKMAGILPVADEHDEALGPAGLMRFLNEMMWFPSAFLLPQVSIAAVDDDRFQVTLRDGDLEASAVLTIDTAGRLIDFTAQRYDTSTRRMLAWRTPISAWADFHGLLLPQRGSAVWERPEGAFSYIELDIMDVVQN